LTLFSVGQTRQSSNPPQRELRRLRRLPSIPSTYTAARAPDGQGARRVVRRIQQPTGRECDADHLHQRWHDLRSLDALAGAVTARGAPAGDSV